MSIIVAGQLTIKSGLREAFINGSSEAVIQARSLPACEDFAVSPDPIDANRVNIFEKWQSKAALEQFRNSGTDNSIFASVLAFAVQEYEINT